MLLQEFFKSGDEWRVANLVVLFLYVKYGTGVEKLREVEEKILVHEGLLVSFRMIF